MAHFKYLGEPARSWVKQYGPTLEIAYNKQDGSVVVLKPVPPAKEFEIGKDIGYDITDSHAISQMSVDPRFQRIL